MLTRFLSSYSHLGNSYSLGRDTGEVFLFVPIAERRHGIDCALFLFRELNKGTKGKGNEAVGDTAQDTVVLSEDSV